MAKFDVEESWKHALEGTAAQILPAIREKLIVEINARHRICPPPSEFFTALNLTPLPKVKVVILGQDPYHGPGQAHGLSFSVRPPCPAPPSLKNIFKELHNEFARIRTNPDLSDWAKQGVLLLNSVLSVRQHMAASHAKFGWQEFTDAIIRAVVAQDQPVVFLLWGNFARSKRALVPPPHKVFETVHPSPLSAHNGFFGCGHFQKANAVLAQAGRTPIDWIGDQQQA
ncbi:MAG: uracil-DNA glycosylase [Pseudomonadota bacterium]